MASPLSTYCHRVLLYTQPSLSKSSMNLIKSFAVLFAATLATASARSSSADAKAEKTSSAKAAKAESAKATKEPKARKSTKVSTDTIVYIFRHGEKMKTTINVGAATSAYNVVWDGDVVDISPTNGDTVGSNYNDACDSATCAQELNPLGLMRASLLGQWFQDNGILSGITDIFATSKHRTQQTAQPAAELAGITIKTYPVGGTELDPQSAERAICPTIDAIKNVSNGSQLLVASHSDAIYQIMGPGVDGECTGFGIDMSNEEIFPKDEWGDVPSVELTQKAMVIFWSDST